MALSPGTRLGRYEVVAPLGAGGIGEVFRARDTKLGRDVALKVLPDHFLPDSRRILLLRERELVVLDRVTHGTAPADSIGSLPGVRTMPYRLSGDGRSLFVSTVNHEADSLRCASDPDLRSLPAIAGGSTAPCGCYPHRVPPPRQDVHRRHRGLPERAHCERRRV